MNDNRIFVDTNILIYAFTSDEPDKQTKTLRILDDCQPVVSMQVLREFANVLLKKGSVSHERIATILGDISEIASVINEEFALILHSIDIHKRYKLSFYDSLIIAAAEQSQCQILLSEDMQDGQVIGGKLRIVNPFR